MMRQDWHSANIIAALKSGECRWRRFPVMPGWRPPRWLMRLPATGPKAKD